MDSFKPSTSTLRGGFFVAGPIEEIFPLFSPGGERLWVPNWAPELLYPEDTEWAEGQVFRTRGETGDVVWIVNLLDRQAHLVVYHRVEPGLYFARVTVGCRAGTTNQTAATVEYSYLGLTEAGNIAISAMTQEAFAARMNQWSDWIDSFLRARKASHLE